MPASKGSVPAVRGEILNRLLVISAYITNQNS